MTDAEKDHAAVRVLPPGVPLATVLVGVGLQWLWPIHLGFELPSPARHWLGGIVIAGALIGLALWPLLLFRRSGQSPKPWDPTSEILREPVRSVLQDLQSPGIRRRRSCSTDLTGSRAIRCI